jgi:DNA-directed RNA polymerase subunit M/transcription elongation factor TFIIS
MPLRFCETNSCNNILQPYTKNNERVFQCSICLREYESNEEDTLVYSEDLNEDNTLYKDEAYLKNAIKDNLLKLVFKDCKNKNCKETIAKVLPIDKKGQSILICTSCGHKF